MRWRKRNKKKDIARKWTSIVRKRQDSNTERMRANEVTKKERERKQEKGIRLREATERREK